MAAGGQHPRDTGLHQNFQGRNGYGRPVEGSVENDGKTSGRLHQGPQGRGVDFSKVVENPEHQAVRPG